MRLYTGNRPGAKASGFLHQRNVAPPTSRPSPLLERGVGGEAQNKKPRLATNGQGYENCRVNGRKHITKIQKSTVMHNIAPPLPTAESSADQLVRTTAHHSTMGLIVVAAASLFVVATIKGWYFYSIFENFRSKEIAIFVPVAVALVSQAMRFVFLLSSAKDLGRGNITGALIGSVASLGMIIYELSEAWHWVEYWAAGNKPAQMPLFWCFVFLILSALFCEARLCITLLPEKFTVSHRVRTLTAQVQQAAEQEAEYQKRILELTGKTVRYEQEKAEQENRKRIEQEELIAERERLAKHDRAEMIRRLEAEKESAQQEADTLRRKLEAANRKAEKNGTAAEPENSGLSRERIEAAVREFYQKTGTIPTKEQTGTALGVTERTIHNYMNGSWKTLLDNLASVPV